MKTKQFKPSNAKSWVLQRGWRGSDGRRATGNKAVECGGLALSKRRTVLAASPAQTQGAKEQEKQDDMTLSAVGRRNWEPLLTYPVPPIAGIVALALGHVVIHHDGTSLSLSARGVMLKSWTVQSGSLTTSTSPKTALKKTSCCVSFAVYSDSLSPTPVASPSGLVVG